LRFYYDENAGKKQLVLEGELFHYVIRVKRKKKAERILFVNFVCPKVFAYEIARIEKNKAELILMFSENFVEDLGDLHLAWAVVDNKTIEKTLPFLNELGVAKLSFVYADRSQKNFSVNMQRLKKILIKSSCQCGRISLMDLEVFNSLQDLLMAYPKIGFLNFGGNFPLKNFKAPILVGPEGGFSPQDLKELKNQVSYFLPQTLVLKSQTAIIALASSLVFV